MDLTVWVPTLALMGWFVVGVVLDPRRFGLGLVLTTALVTGLLTALASLAGALGGDGDEWLAWVMLVALLLVVLAVAVLGVFLVINAFTMLRREGLGLATILSGGVGAAAVAYVVAGVLALVLNLDALVPWLVFLGLPAGFLGFLFVAYLMYSLLYLTATRLFGGPVDAVVVLGSGLGGGERVTPLLAGRLEQGRRVFERSRSAGRDAVLVVSGGRGEDEKLAEAEAMAGYLTERGFDDRQLVLEDASTDTEENLEFSAALLAGHEGKVAVATSDYHAFRAAIIMRKAGIPGYTVGCRTARYYWPSATVREFLAILLEHSRLNLIILIGLSLPLLFFLFNELSTLLGL